nr:Uma2 family endonuclease [Spiractinospora alimapuensis]
MDVRTHSRPTVTDLRSVADDLVVPEGSAVEILRGQIHVTPAPVPIHNRIADRICYQLLGLSGERVPSVSGTGIAPDIHEGDYVIPDLIVTTEAALDEDRPMVPAAEIDLVAEVVSVSCPNKDVRELPEVYAEWRIPVYLLVDPRSGDIILHTEPVAGVYRQQRPFRFGDVVPLPALLDEIQLATDEFRRYGGQRG